MAKKLFFGTVSVSHHLWKRLLAYICSQKVWFAPSLTEKLEENEENLLPLLATADVKLSWDALLGEITKLEII